MMLCLIEVIVSQLCSYSDLASSFSSTLVQCCMGNEIGTLDIGTKPCSGYSLLLIAPLCVAVLLHSDCCAGVQAMPASAAVRSTV